MNKIKVIVLFVALSMCFQGTEVLAKVTRKQVTKAKIAYNEYLKGLIEEEAERGYNPLEYYNKFGLLDVNKDNLPELIYSFYDSEHVKICTYKGENVKEVVSTGLGTTIKIYPNKKIIRIKGVHCGQFYDYYYKFDGSDSILLTEKEGDECINVVTGEPKKNIKANVYSPFLYKIKGKKVSKTRYKKYLNNITKNAKQEKVKLYDYNDVNIDKFLK